MLQRMSQFPMSALPASAQYAAMDLINNVGISAELAAGVVISTMSAAVHGLFDVAPLPGMIFPLSTICIIVAPSGSGKTVSENRTMEGFRRFESEMMKRYEAESARFQTQIDAHNAARKGILKEIKHSAADEGGNSEGLMQLLAEHDAKVPVAPSLPKVIFQDATTNGIRDGLLRWPVAILTSDEAAYFVDNRAENLISLINSTNSGSPIHQDTSLKKVHVENPRLAVRLQMQPKAFERTMKRLGSRMSDEGMLARSFLVYVEPRHGQSWMPALQNWLATEEFNNRCYELLMASVGEDGRPVKRTVLNLEVYAQQCWSNEKSRIALLTATGGFLEKFPEMAAKASENIARLAAIFHAFEKIEGDICAQTLRNAMSVYGWFAEEQVRVFSTLPAPPQEEEDAVKLMQWLANYVRTHNLLGLQKNYLLRNGPRVTRVAARLDAALLVLWRRGYLEEHVPSESKIKHILLNPAQFQPWHVAHWCGPNPGFPV